MLYTHTLDVRAAPTHHHLWRAITIIIIIIIVLMKLIAGTDADVVARTSSRSHICALVLLLPVCASGVGKCFLPAPRLYIVSNYKGLHACACMAF